MTLLSYPRHSLAGNEVLPLQKCSRCILRAQPIKLKVIMTDNVLYVPQNKYNKPSIDSDVERREKERSNKRKVSLFQVVWDVSTTRFSTCVFFVITLCK